MVTSTIKGADVVLKVFDRLTDPSERVDLFDLIGSKLKTSTQQRFIDEKDPDGVPWKQSRRAKETGGKTLRLSGLFQQSISYIPSSDQVEIGTNKIQAAIHQFGGIIRAKNAKALVFNWMGELHVRKSVTMPARPYLGFNDDDSKEVSLTVQDWFESRVSA